MISYELACLLKEHNYPYDIVVETDGENIWKVTKAPSLVELIDSCGDNFSLLARAMKRDCYDWQFDRYYVWIARATDMRPEIFGATPEEAVAKLWISMKTEGVRKKRTTAL